MAGGRWQGEKKTPSFLHSSLGFFPFKALFSPLPFLATCPLSLVTDFFYCLAIILRISASSSLITSPLTSIVTLWIVPLNSNGES